MLDHVSISHESGLVLWSRSYNPSFDSLAQSARSPINTLVRDVMIENKANPDEGFEKDGLKIRWTVENGLGLVFVVVFPALLPLTYIPDLLSRTKALFLSLFTPYVQALIASLSSTTQQSTSGMTELGSQALKALKEQIVKERWREIFDRCLRGCEERAEGGKKKNQPKANVKTATEKKADESLISNGRESPVEGSGLSAEEIAKNIQAFKTRLKPSSGRSSPSPSGGKMQRPSPMKKAPSATDKIMRKWGDSKVGEAEMAELDFSGPDTRPDMPVQVDVNELLDQGSLGQVGKDGMYEVADWDVGRGKGGAQVQKPSNGALPTEEEILARGKKGIEGLSIAGQVQGEDAEVEEEKESRLSSLFSRLTGKKVLSASDLDPVLREMEKHLMSKNVAKDISEKLCEGVGKALVGKKLGGMTSVKSEVDGALSTTITQILSPKTSTDILLDIKRKASQPLPPSADPNRPTKKDPYAMTFVGVNGVGKSTNLSKVAFWLLQNNLRVLIAACDTFRSGAVEQLRVHVRNLGLLESQLGVGQGEGRKLVDLYERGYGKDAAGIAKDAIAFAKENDYDVVLIDTAGRMQDNEPLMRALAKLVTVNNPDKIVFVGEALVGNEAVDQLSKFDRSLKDFSAAAFGVKGKARGIDGMILTKFDTIDDKVGAALSMTYITGQPILFVGCGQTYSDLRALLPKHIVTALLSA